MEKTGTEQQIKAEISAHYAALMSDPSKGWWASRWQTMDNAPKDGRRFLAIVDGKVRVVAWCKTSHVPIYGFNLVDQGVEDREICEPTLWINQPTPP